MKSQAVITSNIVEQPAQAKKRRVLFYLKLVVSVGLLAFILSWANLREVWYALRDTNVLLIVAAAALNPIGGTITALRWQGLLKSQGVDAPLLRLIQSCVVASFFRQFLPSTIGGDAIRAYDSWKMGASKSVAVSTLAVDRVFGLVIMLVFSVVAILLAPRILPEIPLLPLWIGLAAGGLASIILLIFLPSSGLFRPVARLIERLPVPFRKLFNKFTGSLAGFQGKPRLMVRSLGLSVLMVVNVIMFYVLIGTALGLPVPFLAYFVIVPIAAIVMMIPISINAIGLREGVFIVLLGLFGVGMSEAIALAWIEYGLYLLYGVLGGIVYTVRR